MSFVLSINIYTIQDAPSLHARTTAVDTTSSPPGLLALRDPSSKKTPIPTGPQLDNAINLHHIIGRLHVTSVALADVTRQRTPYVTVTTTSRLRFDGRSTAYQRSLRSQ